MTPTPARTRGAEPRRVRGQRRPRSHCKAGHRLTEPDPSHPGSTICRVCSRRRAGEQLAAIQQAARLLGMLQVDYVREFGWSKVTAWQVCSDLEEAAVAVAATIGRAAASRTASTDLVTGSEINNSMTHARS